MATPYHRLARETPAYAWWKLPVAGTMALAAYIGLMILLVIGAVVAFAVDGRPKALDQWLDSTGELDLSRLDFFALDMLSVVLLLPAVLIGVAVVGPRPIGYLSSVTGRLRWGWLALTSLIAFAVFGVTLSATLLISAWTEPGQVLSPGSVDSRVVTMIVVVLLLVPLQSTAEEYVFRGYLMQLVGSWSRFAFLPVVVTTPLFVAGHLYELWGLVDVGVFAVTAAVLTIRTGGLEAAIAAHVANNVVLFVLDALGFFAVTDASDLGPVDVVPTLVSSLLILVAVELAARRRGIQRTREPLPDPEPPAAPMWPPPPYAMPWYVPQPWQYQPRHPVPPTPWDSPGGPAAPPPALHPDTPDYPGELPPDWNR